MRALIISAVLALFCGEASAVASYNDFKTNPYTSKAYRKTLSKYLLPEDHPIKPTLDKLFTKSRVTSDLDNFKAAGFELIPTNLRSFIVVARHPELPGYIVKVNLDSETKLKHDEPSWLWFSRRCELARKIQSVIKKQKCYYFSVAKKWIYPLPTNVEYRANHEILVVSDMELASKEESDRAWKNMSKKQLRQLYTIITYAGGCSYRKDNIPFTKSGKFAFIDTEYPFKTPNYDTVTPALSSEMQEYWMKLVRKGGLVQK